MNAVDVSAVRLLGGERVEQIVDLTTGQHGVARVNDRYLVKKCASRDALEREVVGLYLFGRLSNAVPHLVTQGADFVVTECLPQAMTASVAIERGIVDKAQVEAFIATFLAKVYWKYQRRVDNLALFPLLSWTHRLRLLGQRVLEYKPLLENYVGARVVAALIEGVKNALLATTAAPLTFLHRDIHLDNVLVSLSQGYPRMMLIDVEHCQEGPLELEVQNALFWDDEKSLEVAALRRLLRDTFCIPYSLDREKELMAVYVVDQLCLASEVGNEEKLVMLAKRIEVLYKHV